jgi:hypothetical protein
MASERDRGFAEEGRRPGEKKLQRGKVMGIDRGIGYRKNAGAAVDKELITNAWRNGNGFGNGAGARDIIDYEGVTIATNGVRKCRKGVREAGQVCELIGMARQWELSHDEREGRLPQIIEKSSDKRGFE